ncbi:DNA polymerase III subunit delta [Paenibacillus senegalensis]|uniref:DNA polymerase III subunit delta n=1 Tax=Paenibacillus senegalensis TaxID=1465766 RepID=UPI0002884EF1|nr:DNA polymerase III subunit delta [Paenibacillus senegalensis]
MELRKAVQELNQDKVRPLYVCYGLESFRKSEFISFLTDKLVQPEEREFAVSRYDLAETSVEQVLEDVETSPFLVSRKLVIASNALFLTGAKDTGKVSHNLDHLLTYLKQPVDTCVFVLSVEADKLDERKKIVKQLKQQDCLLPFPVLSAEELNDWVVRRARSHQFSFAEGVADHLILCAGTNLHSLASEIQKLSIYIGIDGVVSKDIIDRLVVRTTEQNVFILIDYMVRRQIDQALSTLTELAKQKEEPIKLLALMARQFRMIIQVKESTQTGYSYQQIASAIGAHPYAVKIAAEQGKLYETRRLLQILSRLADLDYQMKSGQIDKWLGLELLLLDAAA